MTRAILPKTALHLDAIAHPDRFADIMSLDDMKDAMRPEAGIKTFVQDDLLVMRYTVSMPETFRSALDLEARSLVFDRQTGILLSRTFHKFFNLGEREGLSDLSYDTPGWLEEKLDGSMIGSFLHRGQVYFHTRGGLGPKASAARAIATPQTLSLVREAFEAGYTALFEYTAPDNRIVVPYSQPALTLLTLRHRRTGVYNRTLAQKLASRHHHPIVSLLADNIDSEEKIVACLEALCAREDIEGGVLVWPNGRRLKVKTPSYLARHKVLADLSNEREVYRCFLDDVTDDTACALGGDRGRALSDFATRLYIRFQELDTEISTFVSGLPQNNPQAAITEIKTQYSGALQSAAFAAWNGERTQEHLRQLLRRRLEHAGKRNALKAELGLPDWTIDLQGLH